MMQLRFICTKKSSKRLLILAIVCQLISGCNTLKVDRIVYNHEEELYEYPASNYKLVPLRNENSQLISESNYDNFVSELELKENKYPFNERLEQAESIKKTDYEIATLYSKAVGDIKEEKYSSALDKLETIKKRYPDATKYSDCSFLEAYTFQKMDKQEKANEKYKEYLDFSSGKYSERFRGYRETDLNDTIWSQQRAYSKGYLAGQTPLFRDHFLQQITPKYYYNSLQPGYSLNPEDSEEGTKHMTMFVFGLDRFSNDFAAGIQYYRSLNNYFDMNAFYFTSGTNRETGLAIPVQVYKSEDNRFAVKISPFMYLSTIGKLNIDNSDLETDEELFNYGIKASAGYYLIPKMSIGAYYSYNRYHENNPYSMEGYPIDIWYYNEYDISLYYNLFKSFSLKSGIKSGDFVAGVYWSGWEISYNIRTSEFIFRVAMY